MSTTTKTRTTPFMPNEIKTIIMTNDDQAKKALLKLYSKQTAEEVATEHTRYKNNVGFNGRDAKLLTSFSKQLINKGWLSNKQLSITKKRLVKYTNQLTNIINAERGFKIEKKKNKKSNPITDPITENVSLSAKESYTQELTFEASDLENMYLCPVCNCAVDPKAEKDNESEITHWTYVCKECQSKISIWND
jgi:uncharacterized protein YlaI